ncbi:MAG: YfiR family protein [Bryobacteraceae bacterium]
MNPRVRKCARLPIGLALLLTFSLGGGAARGQEIDEYQLKAACLYNIAKFVEWPAEAFKGPADPIVVCILGGGPLGSALEPAVKGKPIGDRSVVTRGIPAMRQAGGCHIVFFSASERKRERAMLSETRPVGILTVGESASFASEGGVINFKIEGERVRIQINVDAAERAKVRISAKLLSLAQIVKETPR